MKVDTYSPNSGVKLHFCIIFYSFRKQERENKSEMHYRGAGKPVLITFKYLKTIFIKDISNMEKICSGIQDGLQNLSGRTNFIVRNFSNCNIWANQMDVSYYLRLVSKIFFHWDPTSFIQVSVRKNSQLKQIL